VNLASQVALLAEEERWGDLVALLGSESEAVEQDPSLLFYLGVAYLNLERADEAVGYLRLATEGEEANALYEGTLGLALLTADRAAEAEVLARRLLSSADTVLSRSLLGMALRKQGKSKEAAAVYDEGLIAHPSDSDMLRVIGDFLSDTMRASEAQEIYAQADRLEKPQ